MDRIKRIYNKAYEFAIFHFEVIGAFKDLYMINPTGNIILFTNWVLNSYIYVWIWQKLWLWRYTFGSKTSKLLFLSSLLFQHGAFQYYNKKLFVYVLSFPTIWLCFGESIKDETPTMLRLKLNLCHYVNCIDRVVFRKKFDRYSEFMMDLCEKFATTRSTEEFLFFIYHPLILFYKDNDHFIKNLAEYVALTLRIGAIRRYIRYLKLNFHEDSFLQFCENCLETLASNKKTVQTIKMVMKESNLHDIRFFRGVTVSFMRPKVFRYFLSREPFHNYYFRGYDLYEFLMMRNIKTCNIVTLYGVTPTLPSGSEQHHFSKKWGNIVRSHQLNFLLYCLQKREISLLYFCK